MNETDVTGPLPVLSNVESTLESADAPSHGPVGWITEANRRAAHDAPETPDVSSAGPDAPAPTVAAGPTGADPDLLFDFASEPAEPTAPTAPAELPPPSPVAEAVGPDTMTAIPVVPALEIADDPVIDGPTDGPTGEFPPVPPAPPVKSRHGQPAPLSRAWNRGIAAAIAVAAVVVGIIAANHASSSSKASTTGAGPAFVLPTAPPGSAGGAVGASSAPGLDALPTATAGASARASAGPSATSGVPADAPSITVLNQTTTHGLAATEAARLRSAGWTVRRVTNINDRLTQTTVYYDASQEAAAKALVASVPSVKAALPRPSYVLATGGLIVVVAADAA